MRMELNRYIGLKAQEARRRRGLSQAQVAERIGKSIDTVSNLERGFTWPALQTLAAYAEAVECSVAEFFQGYGEAPDAATRMRLEAEVRLAFGELTDRELMVVLHLAKGLVEARDIGA